MQDSTLGRLVQVLTSPVETFRSIAEKPSLVAVMVAIVLSSGILGFAVHQNTDYGDTLQRALEQRDVELDADQFDSAVALQQKVGGFFSLGSGVIGLLILLPVALVYWVIFKLLGSDMSYLQGLSTYLHGILPMVLYALIAAAVLLAAGDLSYEQITTRNFLASNLSFLAPADAGLPLRAVLVGLDFFALWAAFLLFLGFRAVARVSSAAVGSVVAVMFLLKLAFALGMAAMQSGGLS